MLKWYACIRMVNFLREIRLSYIIDTVATDILAMQGARASVAMVLRMFSMEYASPNYRIVEFIFDF